MLQLFKSFFLIGLGAYGGGLVIIPLIQYEIVVKQSWLSFEQMASLIAIAQMTPGPIAVNAATFVGFRLSGFAGAGIATFAVLLPSITILACLTPILDKIKDNLHVKMVREGIQLGVLSLIIFAVWSYGKAAITGWLDLLISIIAFAVLVILEGKMHPVFVILGGGIVGLFLF